MKKVTIYYLELKSPSLLNRKKDSRGLQIHECEIKQFQVNRFFYQIVGESWKWTDWLSWSVEQWKAYAENDNLRTWLAHYKGSPAGYYELQRQDGGDVEIVHLGLASKFIGQGFGGYLLSQAIKAAWEWKGTKRVWVHTCSNDHPNALQNYKARGMEIYRVETVEKALPRTPTSAANES